MFILPAIPRLAPSVESVNTTEIPTIDLDFTGSLPLRKALQTSKVLNLTA